MRKPLIYVCSPYKGDVRQNTRNARRYCRFVYEQGDIPFAPHLLFTQFLNDGDYTERADGMNMGLAMLSFCDGLWAFGSPTPSMAWELEQALKSGKSVRYFDADRCRELLRWYP